MCKIDVQNLDAIVPGQGCEALQVPARVDDEVVPLARPEPPSIEETDHVDRIAKLKPSLCDLPRFPLVRMAVGERKTASHPKKAFGVVREQYISLGRFARPERKDL